MIAEKSESVDADVKRKKLVEGGGKTIFKSQPTGQVVNDQHDTERMGSNVSQSVGCRLSAFSWTQWRVDGCSCHVISRTGESARPVDQHVTSPT